MSPEPPSPLVKFWANYPFKKGAYLWENVALIPYCTHLSSQFKHHYRFLGLEIAALSVCSWTL